MTVKVFDNIFTEEEADDLEDIIINLPWFYNKNTIGYGNGFIMDDNSVESWQLVHKFYPGDDGQINSPFTERVRYYLDLFCERTGNYYEEVYRAKANFQPRWTEDSDKYNTVHVDTPNPHHVLIYYVNDSDGDTFFFDRRHGEVWITDGNYKVIDRVSPKKGRFVLFDGSIYHAGSNPREYDRRMVLNFDMRLVQRNED